VRPTKPFEIVTLDDRFACLPAGETVLGAADASRASALEFCTASRFGWGRDDLLAWLNGSYRDVVRLRGDDVFFEDAPLEDLDDSSIARLVSRARARVVDMIEKASTDWRGRGFAREMIDAGFVVGVSDESGGLGYLPQNRLGARLEDRVLALFLADFLTRPRDYESLVLCSTCGEISFAWEEVHSYDCGERGPNSGIVVKRPNFTRLGLGAPRSS
jgi:hypothetical protein